MLLLIGFALLAGAGTALSPCVLPVLPALLSAGGAGGRRRPLGVVLGLAVTFTVTIIGVAKVVDGVGLGTDPLRALAVAVLIAFGLALIVPRIGDRIEARLSRVAALGPRSRGTGFLSGLAVGGALGFVYTPCAGPILAAVISVSAATGRTVAVAIAYAAGSAVVLLALTLGGRRLLDLARAAGRGVVVQRALGLIMVATAAAIVAGVDVRFDEFVARHIPDVNLTAGLERSHAVTSRLPQITGRKPRFAESASALDSAGASSAPVTSLPVLGAAPDFAGTQRWFNTPGGRPLTLSSLRGRVVLVDFWTYTCINCIRTLPYLEAWDSRYRASGLTIVGVHTPEFSFEHDAGNVAHAIAQFGIRYPVAQDNDYATWNAYGNQYWPADYLVDATGQVRYAAFGEGDYGRTETAIRTLLAQTGHARLGGLARPAGVVVPSQQTTPETYLGTGRGQGWVSGEPRSGVHTYRTPASLALNQFAFGGTWRIAQQPATALAGATVDAEIMAKHVYLVLSSAGGAPRRVQVSLDGRPAGQVTVTQQRLYQLASLPSDSRHHLRLRFAPGVSGYAFTFG